MSMTISIRIKPLKSATIRGQLGHDFRQGVQPRYVDAPRSVLNTASAQPTHSDLIDHARAKCARPPRSDWSPCWSGIVTFGTDGQHIIDALPAVEQDRLYKQISQRISDYLKVDLHYISVHRDESAPHCHFMICGINNETGKSIRPKPQDLKRLQDIAGECCAHLNITRGVEKSVRIARGEDYSKTIHRSVKQLHQDLPREIHNLEIMRDNLSALFKKLPKAPRPEPVEIIKKRRFMLPPETEIQKVITPGQREEWFDYAKSKLSEYFAARELEIDRLKDRFIAERYKVAEKMREIELIHSNMQRDALSLKRELSVDATLSHARRVRDEAMNITTPSL